MDTRVFIEWIVVALVAALSTCATERTLEMVHVIYRHGNRAPMSNYPTDSRSPDTWPLGLGQLTNIGKLQQYHLGEWLRKRYGDILINTTYNPKEIYARSSDIDRTLMSAQCNLAGLFPPKENEIWFPNNMLTWQPIPIHTTMVTTDSLIGFPPCPKYAALLNEVKKSDVVRQYEQTNKAGIHGISRQHGL
ncbi:lysosomal acid phosphatase-like [Saccoglossus kowalevskii]